jgi:hypothetical protein
MPLKGVHCVRGNLTMDEHVTCMTEEAGPPCGIEPSILQLITRPNTERVQDRVIFSPSTLSACHRQSALARDTDWYMDVSAGYKMVRGSIIHEGMGHEPPYPGVLGVLREQRMRAPVQTKYGEKYFAGKPDLVVIKHIDAQFRVHVKIVDYKTKGEITHDFVRADDQYVYQINEYAWLVTHYLPGYLNGGNPFDWAGHLFLAEDPLPHIDGVVVDELSIQYMDMKTTRTFTSLDILKARGKMLGDKINGRWVRRNPVEYAELELEPLHHFSLKYIEGHIRKGIENQIEAETLLAPPVEGDRAKLICRSCAVRDACYLLGRQEGYRMDDQKAFVSPSVVKEALDATD